MKINHLFPPDAIHDLPTWRFYLHFIAPDGFSEIDMKSVINKIREIEFQVVTFPFGKTNLTFDQMNNMVTLPIEVPESVRRSDEIMYKVYESDVWKIIGNMVELGFGDLFYEAVDWQEGGTA